MGNIALTDSASAANTADPDEGWVARSGLGSLAASAKVLVNTGMLRIAEEPFLTVVSLRQARVRSNPETIRSAVGMWQLDLPLKANGLTGTPVCGCAWIEPHAWLVTSIGAIATPATPAGILMTSLSDRFAAFRLSGAAAVDVIAAACDPNILEPMSGARTRFAGLSSAHIQQWADQDYRLMVDVSIAETIAKWLQQTAMSVEDAKPA
jgi:sarcosine oxidase gamma subunit